MSILRFFGSGRISSELTKTIRKNKNGEELFLCHFQFENFNYIDPETRKPVNSYYLCEVKGEYGKKIYENFIKGQKVLIFGQETNQRTFEKDGKITGHCLLHCDRVEFMGNPFNNDDANNKEPFKNIKDMVKNVELDEDIGDGETFS